MTEDKKGFLLRLPPALFEQVRRWAEQDMRSINGQIEWLLREAVARRGGRDAPGGGSAGGGSGAGPIHSPKGRKGGAN